MTQAAIVLTIILVALVCYAIPSIPISVTTLLAVLAMAVFGVISFPEAFAGFASTAVFLVAGMMIIGKACYRSGLASFIGKRLFLFTGSGERRFIIVMFVIVSLLCAMINATAILALMMPVIDSISRMTDGKISRKATYFPLGVASVMGSGLSSISSSSMITANEILSNAGYAQLGVFTPAIVNLPALIAVIVFYATIGYSFQKKVFSFEEIPISNNGIESEDDTVTWKMVLSAVVLVGTVIAIMVGVNSGVAALLGSCILIVTRCVTEVEALKGVSWSTIIIVGASIGMSTAISNSGAAVLLADALIQHSGPLGTTTLGLCIIVFIIGSVFSNLLADTATVAIMMPIIFSLAATLGLDVVPLTLACTSGVKFALATPICTANMTMIKTPGYRFMDYVTIGGAVNLICLIVTCAVIAVVY